MTVTIDGILYEIVSEHPFTYQDRSRVALGLKRPKGRKLYHAVRYENGAYSRADVIPGYSLQV